jgi:hypothetical protein
MGCVSGVHVTKVDSSRNARGWVAWHAHNLWPWIAQVLFVGVGNNMGHRRRSKDRHKENRIEAELRQRHDAYV